jgi:hypothetical protein
LDTLNRDGLIKHFLPYTIKEKGNDLMINRNTYDALSGRLHTRRTLIRDGKRREFPFSIRIYNLTEIRDLLRLVNLKIHKVFAGWDCEVFTPNSKRMIIITRKEG